MLNRNEMHLLIDELPEIELTLLSRVMEGLKATMPVEPSIHIFKHTDTPLATQFSQVLQKEETVESESLLRKVMFTPLSELLSWVNQSPDTR